METQLSLENRGTTCDPPISAMAALKRRFWPPLKVPANEFLGWDLLRWKVCTFVTCYSCFVAGRHVSEHLDISCGKPTSWSSKINSLKMSQASCSFSCKLTSWIKPFTWSTKHSWQVWDSNRPNVPLHQKIPRRIRLAVARSNKRPKHSNSSETKYYTHTVLGRHWQEKAGQLSCR